MLNKKQLLFAFTFGFLGHSLYNSVKNNPEKFKHMQKNALNRFSNNNFSEEFAKDDNIMDSFKKLKQQASILENKLNQLKN